jgi:hypothetical protein
MAPTVSSMGDLGIGEVEVVEIDVVGPEPPQAGLGVAPDVARFGVDGQLPEGVTDRESVGLCAFGDPQPELRGHHHVVAPSGDRLPHQDLVVPIGPVGVRRVDERGPGVEGMVQGSDRLVVVDLAVHPGRQDHGAVADGRNLQGAEEAVAHSPILQRPDGAVQDRR